MSVTIGIDPGLNGGIALLKGQGRLLGTSKMPVTDEGVLDEAAIHTFLMDVKSQHGDHDIYAIIEAQHAFPKQGKASNFRSGDTFGFWRGILRGLNIPLAKVPSTKWRSIMFTEEERAKYSKAAFTKGEDRELTSKEAGEISKMRKLASIFKACSIFPKLKEVKLSDGEAEAVLIALTGRSPEFRLYQRAKL